MRSSLGHADVDFLAHVKTRRQSMKMRFVLRFAMIGISVSVLGCIVAPQPGVRSGTVVEPIVAGGMSAAELAHAKREDVVLGWGLTVTGTRARFFACESESVCGARVVEMPAEALLGVKLVGRAQPVLEDGTSAEATDIAQLTIARDVRTSRGGAAEDPHRGLILQRGGTP